MKYQERVKKSQEIYSKLGLAFYKFIVLGVSNQFIWRCPTKNLVGLYNENVTDNHLDIGVGTGDIPSRVNFSEGLRLGLMDLNENCLEMTRNKLAEYNPKIYRTNILEKITEPIRPFDSISTTNMLHCLPGAMDEKSVAFDNFYDLLNDGGVLFGSTLLFEQTKEKSLARKLMMYYNEKGIFNNLDDRFEDLERQILDRFPYCDIKKVGCSAVFVAKK